jgi:hypothetical protein
MRQLDHLMTACGWNFPKFAAMSMYPELIRELGGARFASTGAGESSHRDINAAAPYTNHQSLAHMRILQVTGCRADNLLPLRHRCHQLQCLQRPAAGTPSCGVDCIVGTCCK